MDRSRSKRYHHNSSNNNYDNSFDSHSQSPPRSRPRFDPDPRRRLPHRRPFHHPPPPPPPPPPHPPQSPTEFTTFFRILCPDAKAGGVIGKSGSIIKSLRHDTGAWITVQELLPGDNERIIETADNRRREPDGRPPIYSPAQKALILIHERILDVDFEMGVGEEGRWGGERGRATTRLVVPRALVGCLLGKGGRIIEQMKVETRTHIRILTRDQDTPRCVSFSEEIVQVVGDIDCVKEAVAVISLRLKESMHRDRGPFRGRLNSPEHNFPPDDEFLNHTRNISAGEESDLGPQSSAELNIIRNLRYGQEVSGYEMDSDPMNNNPPPASFEDLVFRILCPNGKVESLLGATDGIVPMLRTEVGVDVHIVDPVTGSDESIIVITSEEGPNDELFPAQEALLHIQTHIVDLGPDNDNIITTRLLVPSADIISLEGREGSLSDIRRLTNANVQILPKEDLPPCAQEADELVQIVGEIRAARNALVQVTERLRNYQYRDITVPKDMLPPSSCAPNRVDSIMAPAVASPSETGRGSDPREVYQSLHSAATFQPKDTPGGCASGSSEQKESNASDEGRQSSVKGFSVPLVTRSILEVIIPKHAVPSLISKSGIKLAQISQMSGATVKLMEDSPDQTEKTVQISGSQDQAEKAQSLLIGFILSTQDDNASS